MFELKLSTEERELARGYWGSVNLSNRPFDISPTMRVMPYDGKPADIGAPDFKAGNGCKSQPDKKR